MKPPTIEVRQGTVHVNSISFLRCTPDIIVMHVDTKQKRPECDGCGRDDDGTLRFDLDGEDGLEEMDGPTVLIVTPPTGDWREVVEVGRYRVQIVLWRADKADKKRLGKLQWVAEEA